MRLAERDREVEELQQTESHETLGHRQQDESGHLDERARDPEPADEQPHAEARQRLGEGLDADQSAARHVLEEAGDEADEAADLGPAAQRDEHGQDQRQVRRDAAHAQRRHHARLREAAADGASGGAGTACLSVQPEQGGEVLGRLTGQQQHFLDARESPPPERRTAK